MDQSAVFLSRSKLQVFGNHSSRLDKSETDSGCHLQDDQELVAELQSKLVEMESELRVAKDHNKSTYLVQH